MGDVRVPVESFERGEFPKVCPVTGGATTGELRIEAANDPGAARLLLIVGVLTYVVYRAATRRTAVGVLPLSDEGWRAVVDGRRGRVLLWVVVIVVGVGLVVGGIVGQSVALAVPGILVGVGGAVGLGVAQAWRPFGVTIEDSGRWIVLVGVHDEFERAWSQAQVGRWVRKKV